MRRKLKDISQNWRTGSETFLVRIDPIFPTRRYVSEASKKFREMTKLKTS